jgi:hypothetical protein
MARFGRDRGRITGDREQALGHPVRQTIYALFTTDSSRSLAAVDLLSDLIEVDESFGRYNPGQVLYHRARLQVVGLIPAS